MKQLIAIEDVVGKTISNAIINDSFSGVTIKFTDDSFIFFLFSSYDRVDISIDDKFDESDLIALEIDLENKNIK